jgi:tetratricopeptide (TPR) repeat protein
MRSAVHYACEEFEDALKLDFKALGISQNHYPEEHADIGAAYNSIAREYFSLKKYDAALENYLKVKVIYENVYGEDDSDTAEVYGSIAMTYIKLEDYNHALEWCLKALESQKRVLGTEHPETILRHSILSEIYENLGVYEESIVHLKQIRNFYTKNGQAEIVRIVNERIADNYEKIGNHLESGKYRNTDMMQGGSDE